jgi:hypothetical protein
MTDLSKLAASLTDAQRRAVCGDFAWPDPASQDDGEALLYQIGVWNFTTRRGQGLLTDLGLALRAHLERNPDD